MKQTPKPGCGLLLGMVALAWVLELIDSVFGQPLNHLGVRPRSITGLIGVPLMPWLHGGMAHLISNTVPFLMLGSIVLAAEGRRFVPSSALIVLLSGLGTWLIGGANEVHIGASGLIYGYFGYVLARAWGERKLSWIFIGIFIAVSYGGMIWGLFLQRGLAMSWEGHFCGFVVGVWLGNRNLGKHAD